MRDPRFKAVHRGGLLDLDRHRLLAAWAADCAEHVLPMFTRLYPQDDRPQKAIEMGRAWARGEVSVGQARAASVAAHTAARAALHEAAIAAARAAGQAVATAHMADHSLGAAIYAIKAVQAASAGDVAAMNQERIWQRKRLPKAIEGLVLSAMEAEKLRLLGVE
ncbi:putative immunity protein [Meiothermus sp. CFH 77666]|uniref:putative immunity protein n=1 Tax=Meiothermus sp. CFH 77666 TaxID=2817942 RepID=UPI001AA037FB|nr:hypothetical protein [Meiothermus sp. CFH 77666]MBO1437921.1 hypothetical protein [Meiothermus sp. CFH 77666]